MKSKTSPLDVAGQLVYFKSSEDQSDIEDESVDLFITSPPYWNLKNYGHPNQIGAESYDAYQDRLRCVWDQCFAKARTGGVLVINVNSRRHRKRFYPIGFDIVARMRGWIFWDHVIWYIPNALPQPNHYMERLLDNKFESCLVFIKGEADDYKFHKPRVPQKYRDVDPRAHKKNPQGRCLGNVLRIPAYRPPNVKRMGYHVAAFPEELVAFFMECYSSEGNKVVDPFVGSGTTLKVARVMNRKGIGYEINDAFKELICGRVQENWEVPDWRDIDILHSSTTLLGMSKPRKAHFTKSSELVDRKAGD